MPPDRSRSPSFYTTPLAVAPDDKAVSSLPTLMCPHSRESSEDVSYHSYLGATGCDLIDMKRMGKAQELRRVYRPWSAFSFTVLVQGTWEYILIASDLGLTDGGLAGLLYGYIWSFIGMGLVFLSIAELSSMAPTSSASIHWVSEFAHPKWRKLASHQMGWIAVLAWQTTNAAGAFAIAQLIHAMADMPNPNDDTARTGHPLNDWHITVIVIVVAIAKAIFTIYAAKANPVIINIAFCVHVMGFWLIIICLWTLSPRNTADVVFTQFSNTGNWQTVGLSLMIGQVSAAFALSSADAPAHISEEIKDAGKTVPQAIIRGYLVNGIMGFVMLVTFVFCITSPEDALAHISGYPMIWVFSNTVSKGTGIFLGSTIVVLVVAGNLAVNISATRQTWSFARDGGFPCHKWLARVSPKCQTPVNACLFTCAITVLLSFINIGATNGYDAIISLKIVSLLMTYILPIGCILFHRLFLPKGVPVARWSLGAWGLPINMAALAYAIFLLFWSFWPQCANWDASTFNWAIVVVVGFLVAAHVDYAFRSGYKGSAVAVDGWREE